MDIHPRDESPVVIETGRRPLASVIWLHGLGADGHDFEGLVPELHLPAQPALRFVFPQAPLRPVTINGGYIMRAWYDIAMTEHGIEQNPEHIRESQEILQALIEEQIQRGIPGERIVLAGFSQGGAIALHTGLRSPKPLAGIMSLSAPVPFAENLMAEIHPANAAVPVFMAHGTDDQMVPFAAAEKVHRLMEVHGLAPEWRVYATGHSVAPDEIRDIARWLGRVLMNETR
ncbi:alpha/beta hydrolase [Sulfuricaulis sp.]|jgi:phospholipase/carboxylesterase|uniref:alpha/beta hydrolase n=1 Tax=Sulfuricaulis sp. TaxID=2003553 RepID=UPI00355ACC02